MLDDIKLYKIEWEEDALADGTPFVVARHPELPGCYGFGPDREAALDRLGKAREAYLETLREMGVTPPSSAASAGGSVSESYSAVAGWQNVDEQEADVAHA